MSLKHRKKIILDDVSMRTCFGQLTSRTKRKYIVVAAAAREGLPKTLERAKRNLLPRVEAAAAVTRLSLNKMFKSIQYVIENYLNSPNYTKIGNQ